jgi:glycosyltransferase involved in cell wall biosynthesis
VLRGNGSSRYVSNLRRLAAMHAAPETIVFEPAVPLENVIKSAARSDIGLFTPPLATAQYRYMLPNKLFEYLMAGVPVLSSQLPAVAEILTCYEAGQVCPSLEPKVVAASIAATLANGVGMAQWRSNALAASATDLNWEQEQGQLIGLYRRLLGANTSHAAEALTDYAPATGTP